MNRHPKRRRDPNQPAKSIIDLATRPGPAAPPDNKDPPLRYSAAVWVALIKGGKARADKLSADEGAAVARLLPLLVEAGHACAAYLVVR